MFAGRGVVSRYTNPDHEIYVHVVWASCIRNQQFFKGETNNHLHLLWLWIKQTPAHFALEQSEQGSVYPVIRQADSLAHKCL